MKSAQRIASNTVVQLFGKVVTAATSVLIIAYLSRYLGVAGYGDYTTIFAYLGIFSVFVDLGLFIITVRELAKDSSQERQILGNMLGLRMVIGVVVFAIAYFIALTLPYSGIIKAGILIGTVSQFLLSLNQIPLSLFQARLTMHKATLSDIIGRVALLGLVFWFISLNLHFLYIIVAVVASSIVVLTSNMIMLRAVVAIKPLFNLKIWKGMLLAALPMGIVVILATIYFRIDTVMLSMMKGSFDVGIYGAPYKILEVFLAIPSIFMSSVLPIITNSLSNDMDRARAMFRKAFDFLSLVALPLIAGTLVVATPVMVLIAGSEFALSGPVLKILILALGGSFLNSVMIYTIIAADQQKRLIVPYVAAVIFNIVTNFLVIPHFSYFGAAVTTVATELLVLLTTMYIMRRYVDLSPRWSVFSKALLASAIMGIVLMYINLHVIWLVVIGGMIYGVIIFITKAVTKQDILSILPKTTTK